MTPLEAVNELAAMSFRGGFWKPYRFLEENAFLFDGVLQHLLPLSVALLVLFFLLEIIRYLKGFLEGQDTAAPNGFFVWSALLAAFLTLPGLYWYGVRLVIETASFMAQAIHNADVEAMDLDIQNLMKGVLASTQNPVSLFTAFLELLTPVGLLTVVSYYLVIAFLYALPFVQALFIAVFVLLGPILLPFALWTPTRVVAKKWFLSLLGTAFISVFGIIAYTAISVSGILSNLAMAGERHIPSLVYSFTTLAFLLSVTWSSYRLFGAMTLSVKHGWGYIARPLRKFGVL
jgi:hypothetical protein